MSTFILEEKLKELSTEYHKRYISMKEGIKDKYLSDIRILYPWYTDHGLKHTEAIIQTLCDMVSPQNHAIDMRNESFRKGDIPNLLTKEDIFILLSAALWHDVGMLISREDHGRHLVNYTTAIQHYVDSQAVTQTIYDVACAHGSNKKFDECVNFLNLNFYNEDVSVSKKTLASLLRIADEISEDDNRITKTKEVFENIPKENRIFWEHAAAISYSKYKNHKIHIQYNVDVEKAFKRYKYPNGKKSTITLYMFIVERICKIINEMIVCAPYFSSICRIDALEITIEFQKQKDWICEEVISTITEDIRPFVVSLKDKKKQTDKFFQLYRNFDPDEVMRKIGGRTK